MIAKLQDSLLEKGNKPQSINKYIGGVKAVFDHLIRDGVIKENCFVFVNGLRVSPDDKKKRDCYEVEQLAGAFNKTWDDKLSYMLCMVIYTTGMRNSGIERMRFSDITELDGCRFINSQESKTANSKRMIPLHPFVYEKLAEWIAETGRGKDEPMFKTAGVKREQSGVYKTANAALAAVLGTPVNDNISFYSGRHFYKTMLNAGELGDDVEELFMGHKVSADVKKLYNHLDRQGEEKITCKAREVYAILDRFIFGKRSEA
jgi:integrase